MKGSKNPCLKTTLNPQRSHNVGDKFEIMKGRQKLGLISGIEIKLQTTETENTQIIEK